MTTTSRAVCLNRISMEVSDDNAAFQIVRAIRNDAERHGLIPAKPGSHPTSIGGIEIAVRSKEIPI